MHDHIQMKGTQWREKLVQGGVEGMNAAGDE